MIDIRNLTFSYKDKKTLNNVSLTLKENGISVLIGKNGCGKTTLLDCIIGIHPEYKGTVKINNEDIRSMSQKDIAKLVAYVPQDMDHRINYTVNDFLMMGRMPYLSIGHSYKEQDYYLVEEYAKKFGIEHLLQNGINNISGGEKQMVLLTRSMLQDTPYIIMDEPFSALDLGNQHKIMGIIKKISCEKHILLSTHNPNNALFLNAYVYLMKDGVLISKGDCRTVIKPEVLESVYGDMLVLSRTLPYDEISFRSL